MQIVFLDREGGRRAGGGSPCENHGQQSSRSPIERERQSLTRMQSGSIGRRELVLYLELVRKGSGTRGREEITRCLRNGKWMGSDRFDTATIM